MGSIQQDVVVFIFDAVLDDPWDDSLENSLISVPEIFDKLQIDE